LTGEALGVDGRSPQRFVVVGPVPTPRSVDVVVEPDRLVVVDEPVVEDVVVVDDGTDGTDGEVVPGPDDGRPVTVDVVVVETATGRVVVVVVVVVVVDGSLTAPGIR
jgi:hypothetical protein